LHPPQYSALREPRGLVEIRRAKGTFVAAPKITHDLKELSGFVEDMHALGRKPMARVLGKEIVTASATVARQLALTRGERVVRIRRVRLADGVPLSFDETYLPLEIGKKIIALPSGASGLKKNMARFVPRGKLPRNCG
jgi:GntR family transcriptional regulator